MRMMVNLVAVALVAVSGVSAAAAKDPEKDAKVADPNKSICRSIPVTGSRQRQSVCHTQAEWDAIKEANARGASDAMTANGARR